MKTYRIINQNGRTEVFCKNKLVAYVEDDMLYAINAQGYASQIGEVDKREDIARMLER